VDAAASIAVETAVKHVMEKIKRGKKLTAEDILMLYLGSILEDVRAMRTEAAEREKALREEIEQLRKEITPDSTASMPDLMPQTLRLTSRSTSCGKTSISTPSTPR